MDNLLFASDDDMPVKGGDYSDDDDDTLNANRVRETTLTTLNSTDEQLTSTTEPKKTINTSYIVLATLYKGLNVTKNIELTDLKLFIPLKTPKKAPLF